MIQAPSAITGCRLIHLQQRTTEWHAWRNGQDLPDQTSRITGTVAAIIAGDSVTGKTAHQLWMEWTGRKEPEPQSEFLKKLLEHGSRTEERARRAYIEYTGNEVFDICVEHPDHPWAAASLDGLTIAGDIVGEFKCPISQRIHTMAKRNIIPSYYIPQIQWQLFCTPSAVEAHYWSWFEEDEEGIKGALVVVQRDAAMQKQLFQDCLDFRICVVENRPPASNSWLIAARNFKQAQNEADEVNAKLEAAKKALAELIPLDRDSFDGGGVMATRYYTKQSIDWKKGFIDNGVKEDLIAEAEKQCREPGTVDYPSLLIELAVPPERVKELEDKHRTRGAVDYKKAAEALGLSKAAIKVIEEKNKFGGEVRYRFTVTNDFIPVVTTPVAALPVTDSTAPITIADGNEDPVLPGTESWSGW